VVREVRNFGRLWWSKLFRCHIGRQLYEVGGYGKFCEVREVRKFGRFSRIGRAEGSAGCSRR
jgi:hypothetical protein